MTAVTCRPALARRSWNQCQGTESPKRRYDESRSTETCARSSLASLYRRDRRPARSLRSGQRRHHRHRHHALRDPAPQTSPPAAHHTTRSRLVPPDVPAPFRASPARLRRRPALRCRDRRRTAAVAAIPSSTSGAITGCVNKDTAAVRIVDLQAGKWCTRKEKQVSWNQTGHAVLPGRAAPAAQGARLGFRVPRATPAPQVPMARRDLLGPGKGLKGDAGLAGPKGDPHRSDGFHRSDRPERGNRRTPDSCM